MARANPIRARCPPEHWTPRSPTIVISPWMKCSISISKAHADMTSLYHVLSYTSPSNMFSRMVPSIIHGSCAAYANVVCFLRYNVPNDNGNSFTMVWSKALFPHPTVPITAVMVPKWNGTVISRNAAAVLVVDSSVDDVATTATLSVVLTAESVSDAAVVPLIVVVAVVVGGGGDGTTWTWVWFQ